LDNWGAATVISSDATMKDTAIAVLKHLRLLPHAHKTRVIARSLAPKTVAHNLRFLLRGDDEGTPIPNFWARILVAGTADIAVFLDLGRRGFDCIRETLERSGMQIEDLKDVLDFGCGCGRVIRHWNAVSTTRIYGTDMNEYLVNVCQRCVPKARISKNSLAASLDYADRSFDLVYAFSVFTHLDASAQQEWRDELRRVMRRGGILLLSVHGRAYRRRLAQRELEVFDAGRLVVRFGQYPGGNLCVAFHPEAYVRDTLAKGFEIVDFVPEGAKGNPVQDLYMLRRPD
jgi:SAM-dependent methyltransferase